MKFIFITILVILFLRLAAPVLFRWLLAFFVKKSLRNGTFFYSNMNQPRPEPQSNGNGRQKGGVKIDYIPEQPDRKDFNGGQYVDYEEIK
ncbi:DUF4834 family protein [Pontibacter amylolyticus]|uniref:DUF4834 domain-containing protein n=1 Tax=Pontibacter amylolyticus TaxID=1424080 RepID=A0ABQ1WHR5_9BACT|nr:DUF4834 family protein [Pontibacter amylolyticus]GGG31538.1 hypothetical protein GCM10011323_38640 [Pontibacter amylolyticus]